MLKFKYKLLNINYYQLNYYIMKKILFVALGATLLAAGCQKTEIINQVNPDGQPSMTFSTGIKKLTKSATATGTKNLETQGFVLSAVNAYADIPSERYFNAYYDGLNNIEFNYNETTKEWEIETGDSYFWPGKDRNLVFFALSSGQKDDNELVNLIPTISGEDPKFNVTGTEGEDGIYNDVAVENYVIKGYTVETPDYTPEGVQTGADDDLMVADVVIKNQDSESSGVKGQVDLAFNHTLSKVEFVFSTNPLTATKYPVVINSVVVNKVVKTADLKIGVTFAETEEADNEYDWSTTETDETYATATNGNSESYTIDYNLPLTAAEQTYATWLVIPQDLEEKTVTISYTIWDAQNLEAQAKTFVSVWPLKVEGLVDAWEINQYVKYKVNLSPNMITFKPYLENDWDAEVSVDPSTEDEASEIEYVTLESAEKKYYYVGTLAKGTQVFEINAAGAYVLTADTEITLTDNRVITLQGGVVLTITDPTSNN